MVEWKYLTSEAEWAASRSTHSMFWTLRNTAGGGWRRKPSERKLRLYGCACCRAVWDQLTDPRSRAAVEGSEAYADGQASRADLIQAGRRAAAAATAAHRASLRERSAAAQNRYRAANAASAVAGVQKPEQAGGDAALARAETDGTGVWDTEAQYARQCDLLRDLFGNPFRPVPVEPAWLTPGVIQLAKAAYAERALPSGHLDPVRHIVLADALEATGCDSADLLAHLRSPGPHVRGCWAVDLLLGKE
jgi:hypothetical protein